MAKSTQNFRLLQLLKASETVSKETVAKELGVALASVPVYIHGLKKTFKAEISTVKDGREVIAYKLVNKDIVVPEFRKNTAGVAPVAKKATNVAKKATKAQVINPETGEVTIPDKDLDLD